MRKTKKATSEKDTRQDRGGLVLRNGVYYADWTFGGKRFRVSTKETTEREARKRRAEIIAEFTKGKKESEVLKSVKESLQRANRKRLAISQAWYQYETDVERKKVAASTISHYRGRFEMFSKWVEGRDGVKVVDDVSLKVAREFMQAVVDGWTWKPSIADRAAQAAGTSTGGRSAKTYNDYLAILSQTWDIFIKAGYTDVNPWREIERKERETHTKKELTPEQLGALFNVTSGEWRTLFYIGIYTGLRLKDCVLLEWGNVELNDDPAKCFISVEPYKTKHKGIRVDIPILPPLRDELKTVSKVSGGGKFVIPEIASKYRPEGAAGDFDNDSYISNCIQKLFAAAGLKTNSKVDGLKVSATDYGFHSLRHTFVSLAFNYGIPLPIVQAIVGHTNAAMTRHYLHISRNELAQAMAAFKPISNPAQIENGENIANAENEEIPQEFKDIAEKLTPAQIQAAIDYLKSKLQ